MNYTALLKKSYHIIIKNKFLWLFGFLLGGGLGFNSFGNGGSGYNGNSAKDAQMVSQVSNFISQYWMLILILGLIILLIIIIFAILSIISRGALISSVKKINEKQETGIRDGFSAGWHNFWRILGIGIILFLIIFASIIVLVLFALLFLLIPKIGWIIAILLGLLFIIPVIVESLIVGMVGQMAYCYCVIDGKRIMESLREGWFLFKSRWKNISIVFLLILLISIVVGIALILALLIVGVLLVLIGVGIYYGLGLIATMVYSAIFGLLILIILAIFSGAVNSYYQTVWTLTFLNLTKGVPIEE